MPPKALVGVDAKRYPRPNPLTVRGIHWAASTFPDNSQLDWWLNECRQMGMGWIKVLDHHGSAKGLCERILQAEMIPIARLYRSRPNPGRLEQGQIEAMKELVKIGVRYFEPNNEPNLKDEWQEGQWKPGGQPAVVMEDWLADAETIIAAGGLPGFPALAQCGRKDQNPDFSSIAWYEDAFAYLAGQSKPRAKAVFTNGAWIAVHAAVLNHFVHAGDGSWNFGYPEDPIRKGGPKAQSVFQDDCGLVGGMVATELLRKNFDKLELPVISTEGGIFVPPNGSWVWDKDYPPVTYDSHGTATVAMFDWIAANYPQMWAMCPWLIANERLGHHDPHWTKDCWYPDGQPALPVVEAMKQSAATQARPKVTAAAAPVVALADHTRDLAWKQRGFPRNPEATFQAYARVNGLGAPLSDEWDFQLDNRKYRAQSFTGGIVYCEVGQWDKATHIPW